MFNRSVCPVAEDSGLLLFGVLRKSFFFLFLLGYFYIDLAYIHVHYAIYFQGILIVIIGSAYLNLEKQVVDVIKEILGKMNIPYLAGTVNMVPYVVPSPIYQ